MRGAFGVLRHIGCDVERADLSDCAVAGNRHQQMIASSGFVGSPVLTLLVV